MIEYLNPLHDDLNLISTCLLLQKNKE